MLTTPDDIGSQDCCTALNEEGHLAVIWMDGKYSPNLITGDIFLRYSYDSGETWTEEEQITFTHWARKPRAVWKGDSIHVVWEDWRYSQKDIFYMLSTDGGGSWQAEQRVEDEPGASLHPDVAVVGQNIHVVWRQDSGLDGRGIYYSRLEEEVAVEDEKNGSLPGKLSLTAYPNPFNSTVILTYNLSEGSEIGIYNIRGQEIRTLTTDSKDGRIIWDARNALGNKVSSGIYFARARGANGYSTIKLIYLK